VLDVTEIQLLKQSVPVKQRIDSAKNYQQTDDEDLLEMQNHWLRDESYQTNCEHSDSQLAGNTVCLIRHCCMLSV